MASQSLNGLFRSFVLLAVPLFIVAADIMNAGTISERLLKFATPDRRAASAAASPTSPSSPA